MYLHLICFNYYLLFIHYNFLYIYVIILSGKHLTSSIILFNFLQGVLLFFVFNYLFVCKIKIIF